MQPCQKAATVAINRGNFIHTIHGTLPPFPGTVRFYWQQLLFLDPQTSLRKDAISSVFGGSGDTFGDILSGLEVQNQESFGVIESFFRACSLILSEIFRDLNGIFRSSFGVLLRIFWESFGNLSGIFWESFGNLSEIFR